MMLRRNLPSAAVAACMLCLGSLAAAQRAQSPETFKAHLSPVPINIAMMATVAGSGSLAASLKGNQLTIEGAFGGLRSPATTAQIHRAPKGIPGPVVSGFELTVTKDVKGAISGTIELTPDQIADLRKGFWYVQIQSERAPEGNLWGWLLR
jgi:CHRD domain